MRVHLKRSHIRNIDHSADSLYTRAVILLNEESVKLTQSLYFTHVLDYLHKDPQDKTLDLDYTRLYSLTSLKRERLTVRHKRLKDIQRTENVSFVDTEKIDVHKSSSRNTSVQGNG